jgi:hypothetical protein
MFRAPASNIRETIEAAYRRACWETKSHPNTRKKTYNTAEDPLKKMSL